MTKVQDLVKDVVEAIAGSPSPSRYSTSVSRIAAIVHGKGVTQTQRQQTYQALQLAEAKGLIRKRGFVNTSFYEITPTPKQEAERRLTAAEHRVWMSEQTYESSMFAHALALDQLRDAARALALEEAKAVLQGTSK